MARRNKKKRTTGSIIPPHLPAVLVVMAGLCLCYVFLSGKTEVLGREIKTLEGKQEALRKSLTREQARWSQRLSPVSMDLALRTHGLVMTWPTPDQIVRLSENGSVLATVNRTKPTAWHQAREW